MCLAKNHCCQTELKDGVTSIAIFDTICASLAFLCTVVITVAMAFVLVQPSSEQAQISGAIFVCWFITACFVSRATIGLLAATRKSKKRWAKIHFITHVCFDLAWIAMYLLIAAFFWISSSDLVLVIVNLALNGYFDWILYSVWKSKEKARPHLSAPQFIQLTSAHKNGKYRAPQQPGIVFEESNSKSRNSFDALPFEQRGAFE